MPEWASRRRARECALQFLFGLEFTGYAWDETVDGFWSLAPSRQGVRQYAQSLITGVCTDRDALDAEIDDAVHKWSPDRVGRIERNILRIALYEMRNAKDVPTTVAINEAIELAKMYGVDEAPRFVNGVLDRLRANSRKQEPPEQDPAGDAPECPLT